MSIPVNHNRRQGKTRAASIPQSIVLTVMRIKPVGVDVKVNDGDVIEGCSAVYAPGHAR